MLPGTCPYCDSDIRDHVAACPLVAWRDQLMTVIESLAVTVCAVQELHERGCALEASLLNKHDGVTG